MAQKKVTLTLGSLPDKIKNVTLTQALYALLIALVFSVGYLLGKVQILEQQGGSTVVAQQQTGNAVVGQTPPGSDTGQVAGETVPFIAEDLDVGHLPVRGDENAPVTMVEFSDFECPFCEQFYQDTLGQIEKDYVDTGKVKIYYRHYPLSFHPSAHKLAVASECANEQGKFWEMHDKIFDNQQAGDFADDTIIGWAGDIGLNTDTFASCLSSDKYDDIINTDLTDGTTAGVDGTPSFFVDGERLVGAQPYASFKALIDSKL